MLLNVIVTKQNWSDVLFKYVFATIDLFFITISFEWKIFKFFSLIMFLTFFKMHEKTPKYLKCNFEYLTKIKLMIKWGGFLSIFF